MLADCELAACEADDAAASGLSDCPVVDCVGCSGPLGCGIAGPLLAAALPAALPAGWVCECESSPKLIVYDLNGGSSDEGGAAPAGAVAAGPFGPDNSSGTNNTIKTTRMIAPVSRSFTRSSTSLIGRKKLRQSPGTFVARKRCDFCRLPRRARPGHPGRFCDRF